jgi:hypothetical protein
MAPVPPEILMGEAGICGFWAMVGIAYVYQRNPRMHGWQDQVNIKALGAAILWPVLPDPTQGARYVFSASDLDRRRVRAIIKQTGPPKWMVKCEIGQLAFY